MIILPSTPYIIKLLLTFFLSMSPVLELRAAIPLAVAAGINPVVSCIVAILGNCVPIPFIILLIKRIFLFLRRWSGLSRFLDKLENKAHLKGEIVQKYSLWGLLLFVAIPLPGTGAWTGAMIAAYLDLRVYKATPMIALGVCCAGIITTLATCGVIHFVF